MLVSEATLDLLDDGLRDETLGAVKVKGKSANTSVYTSDGRRQ